jgi:hypothetical protein
MSNPVPSSVDISASLVDAIETDCRAIAAVVRQMRTAAHFAAHSVSSTQSGYSSVAVLYRDAVARGVRVRSLLRRAESLPEYNRLASKVALLLAQTSDAFGKFLKLHSQEASLAGD